MEKLRKSVFDSIIFYIYNSENINIGINILLFTDWYN
jgi:hypothetical protein